MRSMRQAGRSEARRGEARRRGVRRSWRALGPMAAVAALVVAGPAAAIPYFDGPAGFGFDNAARATPLAADYGIAEREDWVPAGSEEFDDGSLALVLRDAGTSQSLSIDQGEYVVDVTWAIENASGQDLEQAIIFLSALGGPPRFPDYSGVPIDVILSSFSQDPVIVSYEQAGTEYFFAGFLLEDFAAGEVLTRSFTYRIGRSTLLDGVTPGLGVGAVLDPFVIPEPATALLVGLGLAGAAAWRRRAC